MPYDRQLYLNGEWTLLSAPGEAIMRAPDDIVQCVAFLCVEQSDGHGGRERSYGGTAFLVSLPSSDGTHDHPYLVTAKHNIEKAKEKGTLILRVNLTSGGVGYFQADTGWEYHDCDGTDVAVVDMWSKVPKASRLQLLGFPTDGAVLRSLTCAGFKTPIGIGDDLLIVGLFTSRIGEHRNLPIARTGIIACMPDEQLQDESSGQFYHAYLAEVRSIGGLSGSPVFIYRETPAPNPDSRAFMLYLLGMIRGHWDYKRTAAMDFDDGELDAVNKGIAIITPAYEIMDVLNKEIFVKERRRRERLLTVA